MKRIMRNAITVLLVLITIAVITSCQDNIPNNNSNDDIVNTATNGLNHDDKTEYVETIIEWDNEPERAEQFVLAIVSGEYAVAAAGFDATMSRAVGGIEGLRKTWEDITEIAGDFICIVDSDIVDDGEYDIRLVTSMHEKLGIVSQIVFTNDNAVVGLYFNFTDIQDHWIVPVEPDNSISTMEQNSKFVEISEILRESSDYPLNCVLTMPLNISEKIPAVVLVHGSGPLNMNSFAYGISIFKDIAEYLSEYGIAVLRYDKRTYSHGEKLYIQFGDDLTVWEETIEDAVLAKAFLRQFEDIDEERIYILGHSLGGMLAPFIVNEGEYAGGVIMAGSPRNLLDIMYDQNIYLIDLSDISESERSVLYEQVDEAKDMCFGLPENYFIDLDAHLSEEYLTATDRPFLIMHGTKDWQIRTDVDFALYQEIAFGNDNIEFRLYDGLNHLFIQSVMDSPTQEDYIPNSKVDTEPLADVVAWILSK